MMKKDDFTGRFVYQLEVIEGVKVPDPIKTGFGKLLDIARRDNESFSELTVFCALRFDATAGHGEGRNRQKDFAAWGQGAHDGLG